MAGNMCPFFIHHKVGPNIFLLDFSSNYLKNLLAFQESCKCEDWYILRDNELQCYNALLVGAVVQLMCETFLKYKFLCITFPRDCSGYRCGLQYPGNVMSNCFFFDHNLTIW